MTDTAMIRGKTYTSLRNHQITGKGTVGFPLFVTLTQSDNQHLQYPIRGVLVINEQGMDLRIIQAVFHELREDGSLGPPVTAENPRFTFDGKGCL